MDASGNSAASSRWGSSSNDRAVAAMNRSGDILEGPKEKVLEVRLSFLSNFAHLVAMSP